MDLSKMGTIHLQNPSHPTALLHKANQMRLSGTLCDVVIMVDSQEFHAHRTVLACTSKMFEILFHRSSQHYTLDFLSPKTFQQILDYAYTATLQAKLEDLDDLLYAAEILEIEYIEEQCLKILETIQSSEEHDSEMTLTDNGTEEEEERRGRHLKSTLISKKHSTPEGGFPLGARHRLAMSAVGDPRPPTTGSSPHGHPTLSPTKAAVDSLMSLGQSLAPAPMERVKTELMQVDEAYGHEGGSSNNGDGNGNGADGNRGQDGPGTPTRSSVITSARELHVPRDDGGPDIQMDVGAAGLTTMAGLAERHLASLYSALPANHGGMPASVASAMPMSPSLAMSMELGAYGSLLQQSFMQREFFSKLGDYTAAVKQESQAHIDRCDICGVELPDSEAVEQHRKLHSGMKTYGCEFCGKHFLDSLRLRMHLLSHSAGAKALVCDQCGNQFSKEEELEAHRRTHSSSDMAVFCLLCGKRFAAQKALQQHMEVHAGVRSYICSECDRTFPSHTALKRHLRSHTGDHPFECEFCGSCFRDESTLKGHKRIHTGEKPYECNGCGKKFSLKHQLETHYRVHTGEKPFECKLCHQRSRDYSAMIKHLRTHNGASPYQCTICQEYCPSLSSMQKHMKNHKPEDVPADWRIEKTYLYLCYV
ncbi:zinc finger and BTB domain-containing protein 16-A [Alosa sapidissima]|uniref:zinc finger and BTB domain-containing protein 16-A n=1 Tax=Alosa sapidissima TaxID=34773 RepID=UPI001C08A9A8|nr:zinc finger and BTB domain-containing protein 16-A [Alosa sapidissima]